MAVEEVVAGAGVTGVLPLPAVEEEPLVLEEVVVCVGGTGGAAAGEVLAVEEQVVAGVGATGVLPLPAVEEEPLAVPAQT